MGQNFDQAKCDNTFWPRPNILTGSVRSSCPQTSHFRLSKSLRKPFSQKGKLISFFIRGHSTTTWTKFWLIMPQPLSGCHFKAEYKGFLLMYRGFFSVQGLVPSKSWTQKISIIEFYNPVKKRICNWVFHLRIWNF